MSDDAYIGLMSGTSMDAIDAVLVSFPHDTIQIRATHLHPYPDTLRMRLARAAQNQGTPDEIGELDHEMGALFSEAANALLAEANVPANSIRAIGSHGQTVRHQPYGTARFSMQIGDPSLIAENTGITTVADFRRRDLAAGGQGAPLVPAFHAAYFGSDSEDRCIVNIGGITNISWLPGDKSKAATGFDTGPGNALMDDWCYDQTGRHYDEDGHWATSGSCNEALLSDMLSDAYFAQPTPKSTGRERFNLNWLKTVIARHPDISPEDIQRTLLELTVRSLVSQLPQAPARLFVCGGGALNTLLMTQLAEALPGCTVETTSALGLDPEWVEGVAFAWLAKRCLDGVPGNLPEVTGAEGPRILGAIYQA